MWNDSFNLHKEQSTEIGIEGSIDIFSSSNKQRIEQMMTMMSLQGTERKKERM